MNKTIKNAKRALIVGFNGGVGQATLSLMRKSETGKTLLKGFEKIFLVDKNPQPNDLDNPKFEILPPTKIDNPDILKNIITEYKIDQVIDLSSVDTQDCLAVCEEAGVDFLCTSVEEWAGRESVATDEAISNFLAKNRNNSYKQSHLIGSGANPGLVNALTFAAIEEFAKYMSVDANSKSLDLYSIIITEEDSTREPEVSYDKSVFPMTWSPHHCLEELFEPRSFTALNNNIKDLGHAPTAKTYRVRCGDKVIEGFAVPHEETRTLAEKFPDVEFAFVYRLPESARRALTLRPETRKIEDWHPFRVIPPRITRLKGSDRLGVLLCSRQYGEFWFGFDTELEKALALGTNATQLQVATGVLTGLKELGKVKGIHFVEDLNWKEYLASAYEILGKPVSFHDANAEIKKFSERIAARQRVHEYAMTL